MNGYAIGLLTGQSTCSNADVSITGALIGMAVVAALGALAYWWVAK